MTERGRKHLRELARRAQAGDRAVVLFCVQRGDAERFRPADHIDREYARSLAEAVQQGVEALAYAARVSIEEIRLARPLPVDILKPR